VPFEAIVYFIVHIMFAYTTVRMRFWY